MGGRIGSSNRGEGTGGRGPGGGREEDAGTEEVVDGIVDREIVYRPLPSQERFHASEARFKGFSGPIGSGKSQALCQEAVKLSYLNPGRTGLIGAPTYPMLRDATLAALLEVLEANKIPHTLNRGENYLVMTDTGSRILLRPMEEFERLRGSNLAWFGVDELSYTQEQAWLRLEGRLRDPRASRLCGFAVWTPKGYDWVYERFIADCVEGYETVVAKPFENEYLLEKIPDYYERLKSSYDGRFYQQEVLGEYLHMNAGRVYHGFEREGNVRELELDPALPLLWALDFNVDPMSSVVAQIAGDRIHVLDEIVLSRVTTLQACEEFESRFEGHRGGLLIYADATGSRQQTTGKSDIQMLEDFFRQYEAVEFRVPTSNPAVRDRVAAVNAKLQSASGERWLLVDPRCRELVKDFEQVCYIENSQSIDKDRDAKRTHLSDALGYLVWQEFHGLKIGERGNRLF